MYVFPNFKYLSKYFAQIYRAQKYGVAMLVYLQGTPTWRPENIVNNWNLLWLSRRHWFSKMITQTFKQALFLILKLLKWEKVRDKYIFFDKHVHGLMSRTAINMKFKMCLFLDEACSWVEKLSTDINLLPLMFDEDNSFVLDLRKWCNQRVSTQRGFIYSNFNYVKQIQFLL